jgi:uncharacterized membrane protein
LKASLLKLLYWFGTILLFTALTLLFVYVIPNDSPAAVLTYVFGFVFVAFVPGYCLVNLLFATRENKLGFLEELVLSVALSFSVVGLAGLFLGLSPIGISFVSVRLSVCGIVVVLASAAFVRKWRGAVMESSASLRPQNEETVI